MCIYKEDKITKKQTNLFVKPLTYLSMINSQCFPKMSRFIEAKIPKLDNFVDKKFPIWSDSFSQIGRKPPDYTYTFSMTCVMCTIIQYLSRRLHSDRGYTTPTPSL